jgi:hypothetical protein
MQLRVSKNAAACGILAAGLLASTVAHANLITNGGFETGDFSGWTTSIDPVFDGVDTAAPQAGTFAAFFGNPDGTSTISQTLATASGTTYSVSFWLMAEPDVTGAAAPNSFSFDWNGNPRAVLLNTAPFGYTEFQFFITASSASTTLDFSFSNTPAFWDFDSVDVSAVVPEPTSLALVLGALGGLLTVKRRSSAKAKAVRTAG